MKPGKKYEVDDYPAELIAPVTQTSPKDQKHYKPDKLQKLIGDFIYVPD
jgi:hypothetical protein